MSTYDNYIKQFIVQWEEPQLVKSIEHQDSNGGTTARVLTDKELNNLVPPPPDPPYKEYVQHESGVTRVVIKERK